MSERQSHLSAAFGVIANVDVVHAAGVGRITIPILPELDATLKAGPTGDLAYIATDEGAHFAKEALGNAFRDACRTAGITKSAHGLRKAAATHAANRGATVVQLEAIFGWEGGQMASLYTRSADRKALVEAAMEKLSRKVNRKHLFPHLRGRCGPKRKKASLFN